MDFIQAHWLDITTTLLGLAYILLEVRISLWLFLVGFLMESLDVALYYGAGLYADCGMEFYYIAMTVYGFVNWKWGARWQKGPTVNGEEIGVSHFERRFILPWTVGTLALWGGIWWLLVRFTDSNVPVADSFTTALSVLGAWALARKYLEQWIIWIVVDAVCCVLYATKGLPFKSGLYGLYVLLAVWGYVKWLREMRVQTSNRSA